MADPVDRAAALNEYMQEKQLEAARVKGPEVHATGYCLNCGEDMPDNQRWCDADCRDDWEKMNNKQRGVR